VLNFRATENIFIGTHSQSSFQGFNRCSCNLLAETNTFGIGAILQSCLVSELQKPSSPGLGPRTVIFRDCGLCSCNIPAETNNFGLGAVLLSCLVSEIQKPSSPGLKHGTEFWGSGLRFCNLLFETSSFGLGAVFLSCLVSELHEPPSPGLELRTLFRSFDLSKIAPWP
jgi:hypothetical protein